MMRTYRRLVASCFFFLATLLVCQALIQLRYGEPYPAVWAPGFAAGATDPQGKVAMETAQIVVHFSPSENRTLSPAATSIMMFTAAIQKAPTGWLAPHTEASWSHFVSAYFVLSSKNPLSAIALGLPIPWLWKCTDFAVVALEAGFC